jgi:hypothetical protein
VGLYSFGYRFYHPSFQRWMNRDPLEEEFDVNLYRFNYNTPICFVDPDGEFGFGVTISIPWPTTLPGNIPLPAGLLPAAGIVGAGYSGFALGTFLDEKFGISDWLGPKIGNLICPSTMTPDNEGYKPKTREKQPDLMGGEDSDPFKGKGPKKGTKEYERWRRQLEKDKRKEGRGGRDNPQAPFEPPQ